MRSPVACFGVDGLLSPADSLREVARLLPEGDRLYDLLLRYETLKRQAGDRSVEAGARLAYLAPLLVHHGARDEQLLPSEGGHPPLSPGVAELFQWLHRREWRVFLITVAPQRHAQALATALGVPATHVASTTLSLERLARYLMFHGGLDERRMDALERDLLALAPDDDAGLLATMDGFLAWLRGEPAGGLLASVKALGGRRKTQALESLRHTFGFGYADIAAIGRLPMDRQLLARVHHWDGLAVLYGGAAHPRPRATVAGTEGADLFDLAPLLEAWTGGGRAAARVAVRGPLAARWRWVGE